jgi:hypothetical protein
MAPGKDTPIAWLHVDERNDTVPVCELSGSGAASQRTLLFRRVVVNDVNQTSRQEMLVCLTPSGALDTTFGTGGVVDQALGTNYWSGVNSLAVQADGNILADGGVTSKTGVQTFALARYLGSATPSQPFVRSGSQASPPPTVVAPDTTLVLLVLDDPLFLNSLGHEKRRPA